MGKAKDRPDPVLETVKTLVEDYIRGEKTADEIRAEVEGNGDLAGLLRGCLGCNSLPHDLLEAAGLDPFETDTEYHRELTITRDGMERNLRLAREGTLSPRALSDWVTDWFSWQIAERPGDDVVLELAGELMMGEETIHSVISSRAWFDFYLWHLHNTIPSLGEHISLGLVVMEHHEALANHLREYASDEITEDALRNDLSRIFRDHGESVPTLVDDLYESMEALRGMPRVYEAIDRFLLCLARTADPIGCADPGAWPEPVGGE